MQENTQTLKQSTSDFFNEYGVIILVIFLLIIGNWNADVETLGLLGIELLLAGICLLIVLPLLSYLQKRGFEKVK